MLASVKVDCSDQTVMLTQAFNTCGRSIRIDRWYSLESNRIAGHCRKMLIPDPLCSLFDAMNTTALVRAHQLLLFFSALPTEPFCEASSYDQDVALLELNALCLRDLLELLYRDALIGEGRVVFAVGLSPSFMIDEYAARNKTTARMPI